MDRSLKEKFHGKPRILVAPLDWGLGHATRCIPVVRELLQQGCEVYLGANGLQASLLKQEFPELFIIPLEGYNVKYAKSSLALLLSVLFQIPKILRSIRREHEWLLSAVNEYDIDAVISDNRYGLYHPKIRCVFISHQLNIKSPFGKWTEKIVQKRIYKYINRFSACWIPDEEGKNNLAGYLSHPFKKPSVPVQYIGGLSRFQKKNIEEQKSHLLFILSGPEPQRSILENKVVKEITHYNSTATIVRGLPGSSSVIPSTNMIRCYNHLPSEELNNEMLKAEYIIARSGYSTIMDIVELQKKSILIPTPGQTEQEYLAQYLSQKQIALYMNQKEFSIPKALTNADQFIYKLPELSNDQPLKQAIRSLLALLAKK